jgi:hypothetical protein
MTSCANTGVEKKVMLSAARRHNGVETFMML